MGIRLRKKIVTIDSPTQRNRPLVVVALLQKKWEKEERIKRERIEGIERDNSQNEIDVLLFSVHRNVIYFQHILLSDTQVSV